MKTKGSFAKPAKFKTIALRRTEALVSRREAPFDRLGGSMKDHFESSLDVTEG